MLYHRIVVPVDSSALSRRALRYAIKLSRHTGSKLTVFHVNQMVPIYYGASVPEKRYIPIENADSDEILNSLLADLDLESCSISKRTATGDPVQLIIKVAKEEKANLIVMGSRGFNWLTGMLLGSVSQLVIKHAPCPVIIVK